MSLFETFARNALNDPYFEELFNKAEDIYSRNYFRVTSSNFDLSKKEFFDLLRYADILSYGNKPEARNLSFKVLSLLHQSYSDDPNYTFRANGILTRLGNFPSLSLITNEAAKYDTIDTLVDKVVKYDIQKTPGGEGVFTDSQYEVFSNLINSNHFSFSGPTSFGKSFIMDAYIKYLITERPGLDNIVILVPTRALINQVSARLRKEINNTQYAILTHPKVPRFFKGINKNTYLFLHPRGLFHIMQTQTIPQFSICLSTKHKK